ncbi:MAG: hypothetical protein HZY76_01985 [Anaerolineae bacterium]|nr:MAG: hypothetical protein HZY76_01985 [Anaerolineae bacterium]
MTPIQHPTSNIQHPTSKGKDTMKTFHFITLSIVTVLLLTACVPAAAPTAAPVKVGSKDFTEELLLGEMYAQILKPTVSLSSAA